jgi:hypothetical protein
VTDLVEFLRFLNARLDEDEQTAKAATAGPWSVDSESYAEAIHSADRTAVVAGGRWGDEASVFETTEDAIHIARHDPARVLREVERDRRILELHAPGETEYVDGDVCMTCEVKGEGPHHPCQTLRLLALPYADHPHYREEWMP